MSQVVGDRRTYTHSINTHSHSYAQIVVPLQGMLHIATAIHQLQLRSDRLFVLPPCCSHTFHSQSQNEFLVLDIPIAAVPQFAHLQLAGGLAVPLDGRWSAWRSLVLAELDEAQRVGASSAHLIPLVRYGCDRLETLLQNRPVSVQFLHNHLADPLNLEALAALEGYTPAYYSEWFKRKMGRSPRQYLQQLRLERAAELLQHTDWAIAQVAAAVGYAQAASLTRLFQRHYGQSPLAHRHLSRSVTQLDSTQHS